MDSGFTIKKSFISEESVEEIKRKKQEEWEKAYANAEIKPPVEEYDSRPLFERLAEQRTLKEEALLEAAKFSNLIHRIDDDEFDFLKTLDDEERKKKLEVLQQEQDELERYRKAVKEASQSTVPELSTLNSSSTTVSKPISEAKPRKRDLQRDILKNAIKRRRASEEESKPSKKENVSSSTDTITTTTTTITTTTTVTTGTTQVNAPSQSNNPPNPLLGLLDYSDEESD